ncbi:MAG TPA: R3H domain-containing nucleic acid-binding protein [Thermomicrobiales bacterium]|nr:R3H domain-containing nucleic acid-binding protein [Thermomicrobiales bacterium]
MSSIPQELPERHQDQGIEYAITDDINDLLAVLPPHIAERIATVGSQSDLGALVEIVMDLGRRPEARFQHDEIDLLDVDVTREDLSFVGDRIGSFGEDNRAGIERTLHRISAIRNRSGEIVGLTCRIGRAVFGTITIVSDLIESGHSVLLLGRPGVGKTTLLRETARVLADELRKRVVVVDTSNEIAGDGDIPHPAIGRARRMQVPTPNAQHAVMIEAVENHMPQVIVIDEIGTELEAMAARTIAERGVQLIGTAHGNSLENLMLNPTLSDLIGGIQTVTLSDEEARRRGTQKSILERKAPPTFNIMVEIVDRDEVIVHLDVAATVDAILRGTSIGSERRRRAPDGSVERTSSEAERRDPSVPHRTPSSSRAGSHSQEVPLFEEPVQRNQPIVNIASRKTPESAHPQTASSDQERSPASSAVVPSVQALARGRGTRAKPLRIFPYGVSRNRLEQTILRFDMPAIITRDPNEADIVMTLKNAYRQKPQPVRDAELRGMPVYVLRSNTMTQMENVLLSVFPPARETESEGDRLRQENPDKDDEHTDSVLTALTEAESAISSVMGGGPAAALSPQAPPVRRMQHELAERYSLASRSRGRDPYRHVEIYRRGIQ